MSVGVCAPSGFLASATSCGLKRSGSPDLALVVSESDCTAAGVFTQSLVRAAPVLLDEKTLEENASSIKAVLANAGIANACTGEEGARAAAEMQRQTARVLGCLPEQVLVLSTGVIGVQLDLARIADGLKALYPDLSSEGGEPTARAIMTTDTRPKYRSIQVNSGEGSFTLGAMAKGSGMIHPNMATMLAVITTDAAVPAPILQLLLKQAVDLSFNRISVDGDTSTNDTVLLLANAASGVRIESEASISAFSKALTKLTVELAKDIVRDGEGASRLVELQVKGCRSEADAQKIASTIATSMLVKTAIAGGDPNWGRIVAAAGRAGVSFDPDLAILCIASVQVPELELFSDGKPRSFDRQQAAQIFSADELFITLDLQQGEKSARMWTCDLTTEYVHINADYHT
ncbi:MAG: bifunctional glutamate N-acetyltransferase/amino-acid acetyltransferase ArgJ [Anaerolineales bacterium]|nr:bifunctional glutamate N-acetyltransferase/amino-acid acetyltransferase ArgJ [Anaerolineales bacterium]